MEGMPPLQTGFPFTPLIGFRHSGPPADGTANKPTNRHSRTGIRTFKGPVILGPVDHGSTPRRLSHCRLPALRERGTQLRTAGPGPFSQRVDTRNVLFKRIPIRYSVTLHLRADSVQCFNHVNNTLAFPNQVSFPVTAGSNYKLQASRPPITNNGGYTANDISSRNPVALGLLF